MQFSPYHQGTAAASATRTMQTPLFVDEDLSDKFLPEPPSAAQAVHARARAQSLPSNTSRGRGTPTLGKRRSDPSLQRGRRTKRQSANGSGAKGSPHVDAARRCRTAMDAAGPPTPDASCQRSRASGHVSAVGDGMAALRMSSQPNLDPSSPHNFGGQSDAVGQGEGDAPPALPLDAQKAAALADVQGAHRPQAMIAPRPGPKDGLISEGYRELGPAQGLYDPPRCDEVLALRKVNLRRERMNVSDQRLAVIRLVVRRKKAGESSSSAKYCVPPPDAAGCSDVTVCLGKYASLGQNVSNLPFADELILEIRIYANEHLRRMDLGIPGRFRRSIYDLVGEHPELVWTHQLPIVIDRQRLVAASSDAVAVVLQFTITNMPRVEEGYTAIICATTKDRKCHMSTEPEEAAAKAAAKATAMPAAKAAAMPAAKAAAKPADKARTKAAAKPAAKARTKPAAKARTKKVLSSEEVARNARVAAIRKKKIDAHCDHAKHSMYTVRLPTLKDADASAQT